MSDDDDYNKPFNMDKLAEAREAAAKAEQTRLVATASMDIAAMGRDVRSAEAFRIPPQEGDQNFMGEGPLRPPRDLLKRKTLEVSPRTCKGGRPHNTLDFVSVLDNPTEYITICLTCDDAWWTGADGQTTTHTIKPKGE